MIKKTSPNYRWYILALSLVTYAVIAGCGRLCMPVLFKQISDDLGLSMVAIGTVWGMDPLAGVFIGLPSGLLADRFGVKSTLTVICILAGVFGGMRGLSVNFTTMAATMFLFGLTAATMTSVIPKVTAEWFSGRQLALTNAMINIAGSIGSIVATMFSATVFTPLLGSWRRVLFVYTVPMVILGLLWLFIGREPDRSTATEPSAGKVPFRQAMSHVMRIKEVWMIGIVSLTTWGASNGLIGYLPIHLRNIGWAPAAADNTITVLNAVASIGSIPMVLLSDKLRTRKGVLYLSIAALAIGLVVLPFVNAIGVWLTIIFIGFLRSGSGSLFNVIIFETKGVGSTYGGTAIGLASTISMVGAFLAPPLGNSLDAINHAFPCIFWGCLAAAGIPLLLPVKEKPDLI